MQHQDHVALLRKGILEPGGIWADLGAGTGAFTLALADLIGPAGTIYAVDADQRALKQLEREMREQFLATDVHYHTADFTTPLALPMLDGIVMANSLHYVRKKEPLLQLLKHYLRPGGRLLLVEYNVDHSNPWVPYPLTYTAWEQLARQNGFHDIQLLAKVPSRFLREMYSSSSLT